MNKPVAILATIAVTILALAGCTSDNASNEAAKKDRESSAASLQKQQASQPVPVYDWSQYRQSLIEITTAKAETTQTTTFFFLEGVGLIGSCPSIGFPVPSTAQLTAPETKMSRHDLAIPQVEPVGVYTGESTGTYTLCVDGNGAPYANYFEGYVQTVTGPAKFEDGQIKLTGKPSGEFTKGK